MDKDGTDDYVTIVSVGSGEGQHVSPQDAAAAAAGQGAEVPFVTVLSIGQRPAEEEVVIYRLPGEKLGFGLKFEGGTKSSECVRRLFIQSCAADSPAGRALAAWGPLQPGDEILHIDSLSVTNLTRLECVRRLKDSNVAVSLLVRHDPLECALEAEQKASTTEDANRTEPTPVGKLDVDKASLPPPVPPRKLNRKNANVSNEKQNQSDSKKPEVSRAAEGITAETTGLAKKIAVGKQSPGRPRRCAPGPSLGAAPLEAQVYTDLFCQEKEHSVLVAESESDDTGSSISTVIDRLSVYSSFPGSVENSIPSTPTLGYKQLNFQNVFSCLDNIGNSLISDVPPSIVDENIKILAKPTNGAALPEKVVVPVLETSAPNEIYKKDFETPAPVLSSNKISELCTRENNTSDVNTFECQISDSNNNKSVVKNINTINSQAPSRSRDAEDCPDPSEKVHDKIASMEAPKPKPRNMNKKYTENSFSARQYDETLSLTKLHCIESWLQDSISCKNAVDEPAYVRDDDIEVIRPEALPRLIDFVPKTHVFKISPDAPDGKERPTSTPHVKSENDSSKDDTNHLRLIITRDPCQDWCNSGGSPQLETIYEDLSTCPTLLIEETSRHPPAGDSGSDQGTQVSIGPSKDSESHTPELKEDLIVLNKDIISLKRQESEECGGVSRGPRPPPDGRENPLVHHDDLPPPAPLLAHFHREAPIAVNQAPSKTNTPNPKDTKRFDHGNRSALDSRPVHESPRRMIKTSEKSYGRGKDAKSEGSVKDKIAMFSVNKTAPPEPASFTANISVTTERRHSTNSNNNSRSPGDAPSHYASLNRSYSVQAEPVSKTYDCKEWHTLPKKIELERPLSESYVRDYVPLTKPTQVPEAKLSPIALLNIALNANPVKTDTEKNNSHKSTLDHLIEQRRKSMSKLRGLVIPESPRVANLPEIKSRDSLKMSSSSRNEEDKCSALRPDTVKASAAASASLISLWDSQPIINTIPKYSPAFKRKSLQVYGPKTSKTLDLPKYTENSESLGAKHINKSMDLKGPVPIKPPRTSLDVRRPFDHREFSDKTQTLPPSFKAPPLPGPLNVHLSKSKYPELLFSDAVESPTFRMLKNFPEAADSDDSSYLSTVSSPTPSLNTADNTESDCSSHCTLSQKNEKKISKVSGLFDYGLHHAMYQPENDKNNVCRSLSSDTSTSAGSSNSSTLTSGSQASCSSAGSTDTGSHRVLKPRSIEAINRKNILASAKCRSGKDNKFGSPLIERKFSDVESTDDEKKVKRVESQYSKARSDGGLANSILKVAYSTVVEDKGPMNETDSTYSDTESDCDFGSVTLTKSDLNQNQPKYTNGSSLNIRKANDVNFNRRSSEVYAKSPPEPAKVSRTVDNGPPKNNIEVARNVISHANFEDCAAEVYPVESKQYECESYEVSSCGVSEDEQDNWCEVRLSRGASGGVGVTLAGGADCEAKQVTIHKVLQGSAAERDGRLRKGDKVLSINGHTMKGVTHAQSVAILKEQLPEVSIVVCGKRTAENPLPEATTYDSTSSVAVSVVLHKADDTPGGAGLGISLQGGGNRPLLINKLFTGGAAANSGQIESGSELVAVGGARLAGLTRTQAWGLLRALPAGPVTLLLRPP